MDPMTMMMLAQMAPTVLSGSMGIAQGIGGAGLLASAKRPKYKMPGYALEALGLSRMNASMDSPGFANQMMQINQAQSSALAASNNSSNMNAAIAAIQANTNTAKQGAFVANDQYRAQRQDALTAALGVSADYQDQAYQINEFAPYRDRKNLGMDLVGAGLQNITTATGGLENAAYSSYLMSKGGAGAEGEAGKVTAPPATPDVLTPEQRAQLELLTGRVTGQVASGKASKAKIATGLDGNARASQTSVNRFAPSSTPELAKQMEILKLLLNLK